MNWELKSNYSTTNQTDYIKLNDKFTIYLVLKFNSIDYIDNKFDVSSKARAGH